MRPRGDDCPRLLGTEWRARVTQRRRFLEIAEAYEAAGGGPCDHPRIDREYDLGSDTGDVGCLRCGMTWWSGKELPKWEPSFERHRD